MLVSIFLNKLIHQHNKLNYRFREHEIGHLFFNGAIEQFHSYEAKEYPNAIQLWLNRFYIVEKNHVPVIRVDEMEEEEEDGFHLSIEVQDQSKALETPIPLSDILSKKTYSAIRLDILRNLAMLSDYFPQISELVASQGKEKLHFDSKGFVDVLFKILPTIRLFGIKGVITKSTSQIITSAGFHAIGSNRRFGNCTKKFHSQHG